MLTFPNSKINLGLHVIERCPDGYHNIETVFYPIPCHDALEFVPSLKPTSLTLIGNCQNISKEDNLVLKAYRMLEADFELPRLELILYKNIPSGAGLGGGSSDAAFMLKMLNNSFRLHLSNSKLEEYAVRLGADCVFFLYDKPMFATGRGNKYTPLDLSLKNYYIVLIKPDIYVSTQQAYSMITPKQPQKSLMNIIQKPIKEWKNNLINDFEKPIFNRYPEIAMIKEKLYESGAVYASMSGSGSTVFALFERQPNLRFFENKYFTYFCKLQ